MMKTIRLPFRVKKPILACGADLKGAFALAKGDKAYLFDGFGDLSDLDNFTRYGKAVRSAETKLNIRPEIVVCDLHPGYFSAQFAENYTLSAKRYTLLKTQHHEAHVASAIVDNGIRGDVLGVAFDGTGYGTDGKIWGGEFFAGNIKSLKRVAHLEYAPMPGGEMCIKEPWRMAGSYIYSATGNVKSYDRKRWAVLKSMIEKKINSPMTSSVGRLFDAVGSLVLNKEKARFEAELPIELERIADKNESGHYALDLKEKDHITIINMTGTIRGILKDMDKKVPKPKISAKFHNTVAMMILNIAKRAGIKNIVLSGGVFQNKFLSKKTRQLLEGGGFRVYAHSNIETNDSGIPIGQIAIVNARGTTICA
jgi:Hydrogenase maturation factor